MGGGELRAVVGWEVSKYKNTLQNLTFVHYLLISCYFVSEIQIKKTKQKYTSVIQLCSGEIFFRAKNFVFDDDSGLFAIGSGR